MGGDDFGECGVYVFCYLCGVVVYIEMCVIGELVV